MSVKLWRGGACAFVGMDVDPARADNRPGFAIESGESPGAKPISRAA